MPEHAPTPWVAVEEPYDPEHDLFARSIYSEGFKGKLIARVDQDFSDTDAAFIVKAVNCHDELVAALKAAEQFIANGVALGFIRMPDPDTPDSAHNTLPTIRAALAKVEAA